MSRNVLNTYNFVSTSNRRRPLDSDYYRLVIRQQPKIARVCNSKERDRRPVDPPPIIQLKVEGCSDEAQNFLQSPYYFMCANLVSPTSNSDLAISSRYLAGTVVSSLHKLKDIDNTDGGFFVFGDISVRHEGRYRLRFSLFEIVGDEVVHIQSLISDVFTVYLPKTFPGMSESTFLSRSFSDQGVRIRIRKEHRIQMKRPSSSRHSDIADGEDNVNDDGIDLGEVPRRKRSRCSSSPPVELRSTGSPYYQRSPSFPTNDGNSNTSSFHCPPPNENHQYELSSSSPLLCQKSQDYDCTYPCCSSEHESFHDDRMSVRSDSYDVTTKSPYSRRSEFSFPPPSDDPRPFNQPGTYSRPLHPPHPHYKPQRRTTLPPLLEHPNSFSSCHQSNDTVASLDSSRQFNVNYQATNSSPSQFPSNSSPPVRVPRRSNTLPPPSYVDSQRHYHHHHAVDSDQPSFVNQLPTPRTSFDHLPRTSNISTSPDSYKDSYSSRNNDGSGNVNITVPRFTQHFTLSPRPSHSQLSSSPLPTNNVRSASGSSMSIVTGVPSSSPRLLTTPLHPTTTTTTTTTTRLPPISALTDGLGVDGFLRSKESPMSITTTPSSSSLSTMTINSNNGSTNYFQSDQSLPRQYFQHHYNTNVSGSMIQNHVHHFTEHNNNVLAPLATTAQDSVRGWNRGCLT